MHVDWLIDGENYHKLDLCFFSLLDFNYLINQASRLIGCKGEKEIKRFPVLFIKGLGNGLELALGQSILRPLNPYYYYLLLIIKSTYFFTLL